MSNSPTHLPLSNEEWEKKIYAYMAHRTESGNDPSVIYRLSHAGPGKSGYSFGSVQIDLAGMKPERQELLQAVDAWLKAQGRGGDPAWMENVTRQLSIKGDANALAGKYKKDINDYLATAEGHSLVDRLSDQTRQNMLKDRKRGIFDSPAAVELLKDSQSLAYIFKLINAGNPTRLRSFLSGKAVRLSSGVSTIPGGQGFDIEAMQGPLEGNVKGNGRVQLAGDRTLPENSDVLQSGTRIIVKKEGFFVKSPYRRFNVEDAPLPSILSIIRANALNLRSESKNIA